MRPSVRPPRSFLRCLLMLLLLLPAVPALAAPQAGDATSKLSPEELKLFEPETRLMYRDASAHISYVLYIQKDGRGPLVQIRRPFFRVYAGPGDKLHFYYTITGSQHQYNNTPRLGFQADYREIIRLPDGKYGYGRDLIPLELKNFRMDGEPCPLWEGLDRQLIPSASTDPAVATHGYEVYGKGRNHRPAHPPLGFNMTKADKHYISFEMTIPENAHYVIYGQGSGSSGQSGGVISARADKLDIYTRAQMQFHYVLDKDYRQVRNIAGEEDVSPIAPRGLNDSFFPLSPALKELAPPSEIYNDLPMQYLFPQKPEYYFNTRDPKTGDVVKQQYDVFLFNSGVSWVKRPTYDELKKDIPGYAFVSDDLSRPVGESPDTVAKYVVGPDNRLPQFDYEIDQRTGKLMRVRHYYFTYKALATPTPAPTPSVTPTAAPTSTPAVAPPTPTPRPVPKTGDAGIAGGLALMALAAGLLIMLRRRPARR